MGFQGPSPPSGSVSLAASCPPSLCPGGRGPWKLPLSWAQSSCMRCKTSDPVPTRGHSPPGVPSCGQCTHAAGPRASPSRAWKERSQVPALLWRALPFLLLTHRVLSARRRSGWGGPVLGPGCGPHRRRHPGGRHLLLVAGPGLVPGPRGDWVMAAPRALHASPSWAGAGVVGLCGHCDRDDRASGRGPLESSLRRWVLGSLLGPWSFIR